MGLDTSHGAWHGPYSSFKKWRHSIASAAGYTICKVKYDGHPDNETIMIDWGHITMENLEGIWETMPNDPLIVLIAHSDCDGKIYPAQAGPLADRLEQLMPKLSEEIKALTELFIGGLRAAILLNEPVDFH